MAEEPTPKEYADAVIAQYKRRELLTRAMLVVALVVAVDYWDGFSSHWMMPRQKLPKDRTNRAGDEQKQSPEETLSGEPVRILGTSIPRRLVSLFGGTMLAALAFAQFVAMKREQQSGADLRTQTSSPDNAPWRSLVANHCYFSTAEVRCTFAIAIAALTLAIVSDITTVCLYWNTPFVNEWFLVGSIGEALAVSGLAGFVSVIAFRSIKVLAESSEEMCKKQ